MHDSKNGAEGFTLIELMIVILIIAILVAIAVPVYLNARASAQRRTCQANLRTVDGAINTYSGMFDSPVWPDSLNTMAGVTSNSGQTQCLKSVPTCPLGNGTLAANHSYSWLAASTAATANTPPSISCPYNPTHKL
jgi:prepilin-type N-terminal cleavage/methylation domain-containing protein